MDKKKPKIKNLSSRHYLEVLRKISLKAVAGPTPEKRLARLVKIVAHELLWDACSIYLLESEDTLILAATYGLEPDAVAKVRLPVSEGLVGSVAEEEKSVFLREAASDSRFKYFPETGEERFTSLAAVPFARDGKVSGVLTVQTIGPCDFSSADTHFLEILASQIGLAVDVALSLKNLRRRKTSVLVGTPGAPGIAEARIHHITSSRNKVEVLARGFEGVEVEKQLFYNALEKAIAEINNLMDQVGGRSSPAAQVFLAHKMILEDREFSAKIINGIENRKESAPRAVVFLIDEYIAKFSSFKSRIMREKTQDLKDLRNTILGFMGKEVTKFSPEFEEEPMVVVANALTPQETIKLDTSKAVGFVMETGTEFSHTVILSRALGLPAVVGVSGITEAVKPGDRLLVDGNSGFVFINPDAKLKQEYFDKYVMIREKKEAIRKVLSLPDDRENSLFYKASVDANIGLPFEIEHALKEDIGSVGLLRTEFFYMSQESWPNEELQTQFYDRILRSFSSEIVTIRLLDLGGDKFLNYMPELRQDNPHFGLRSVRLLLDHPEILRSQLTAIHTSAKKLGCLPRILAPMVTHAWEVAAVRETLLDVTHGRGYPIGAMVENPAAMFQVEEFLAEADFISIGTNDLSQYLLAVDRNDSQVTHLYHPLHPGLLRALDYLFHSIIGLDKPFSICGEMAGDPISVLALLIIGYRHFSLSPSRAPEIHYLLRQIPEEMLSSLRFQVLRSWDPKKTETKLRNVLRKYAPLIA